MIPNAFAMVAQYSSIWIDRIKFYHYLNNTENTNMYKYMIYDDRSLDFTAAFYLWSILIVRSILINSFQVVNEYTRKNSSLECPLLLWLVLSRGTLWSVDKMISLDMSNSISWNPSAFQDQYLAKVPSGDICIGKALLANLLSLPVLNHLMACHLFGAKPTYNPTIPGH